MTPIFHCESQRPTFSMPRTIGALVEPSVDEADFAFSSSLPCHSSVHRKVIELFNTKLLIFAYASFIYVSDIFIIINQSAKTPVVNRNI